MSQAVTFAAGQATKTVSIPITDDTIPLEPDEFFILSLIPNPNVIIIRNGSVTIEDNSEYMCCIFIYCTEDMFSKICTIFGTKNFLCLVYVLDSSKVYYCKCTVKIKC